MICVENKTSAHVEEQEQRSNSADGASHSVVHVKKRQEAESLPHGSSVSSDWRATYRRWFEETKYWAGKKADLECNIEPWFHSRWQQEKKYWRNKKSYSEGHAPWFLPWSQSRNIRRRHSNSGFKYPHTEESKSTNRIWWIGRRRSIGSRPEAAGESQGSSNLKLIVPEGSEPPFTRRSRTLACIQPWMSSKASGSKISQSASKLFKQYVKAVVQFTPRSLTKQSDVLNAFQGILNHFGRLMGAEFVFGLPLAFFDDALLWKHVDDWLSDWFNPWGEYADGKRHRDYKRTRRSVFIYDTKGLKQYEQRIKAREGKGCIRRYDIFEDCAGLPTWSWAGWQGAVDYYGSLSTESELKGKIIWPWKAEYTPPNIPMVTPQQCVLQVEAWIASIDLTHLQWLKFPDIFLGWPVEDGNRVRNGVVPCILLSTDIKRQFGIHDGEIIYNIMIVGRDSAQGTLYRRGIAQLFPEDWEEFKPTKEWIALR
ncbi:hypothetical protein DM02DRAFT_664507 [Periconia macrospinosa]|uniref:Heterokaryon incompatibility domain-containing protein n=1 Tax=Periconia macrospinosa TaxID=97972 RepID=A0A2V1D001_9PLEO|nr:hypothetical protein DM02DRAFT_664507 [Periconia macrospinosa]